jgi:hypothetical protein
MDNSPNPINSKSLVRASIAGVILAVLGIVSFIALWVVLGNAGVDQLARLVVSICLPPALIATLLGVYFLFLQSKKSNGD